MDRLQALRDAQKAHGEYVTQLFHEKGSNRIVCSGDQWEEMYAVSAAEDAARTALMPTEQDAIRLMFDAYQRLEELGWSNPIHCPKDGSTFDMIEAGSAGIHHGSYEGEWPTGRWWIHEDGDMSPSRPVLYRVTEAEIARREEMRRRFREDLK